jgi:hypothetical protein
LFVRGHREKARHGKKLVIGWKREREKAKLRLSRKEGWGCLRTVARAGG